MKIKFKLLSILLLLVISYHLVSAQTIPTIDSWTPTSSPVSAITQRTFGKSIKITGLTTGQCLTLDANSVITTVACGGVGSNYFTNSGTNTFLNTGTNLQFPTFEATSTTGTSTVYNSLKIGTSTVSQDNLVYINVPRNYAAGTNKNGAVFIDNSLNARQAIDIVSSGATRSAAQLSIVNTGATTGSGNIFIDSVATNGGDYDFLARSFNPDIELCDKDYNDNYGCGEIDIGPVTGTTTAGGLRFNLRNDADTQFLNYAGLRKSTGSDRGLFYIDPTRAGLTIGWEDSLLDFSLGKIQVNNNAISPSAIDLSNSIAVGTGASGANTTNKYLGQFSWVSRDSSFTIPKTVAYIGAEATEAYAADIDVGSTLRFYTGTINGTNPTEKMALTDSGNLGIGTSSPTSALSVVGEVNQMGNYAHFGAINSQDSAYCTFGKKCLMYAGTDNTLAGIGMYTENYSTGTSAYSIFQLGNDLVDSTGSHYAGTSLNGSKYNDNTFGTALNVANQFQLLNTDGPTTSINSTTTSVGYFNWVNGGVSTSNEKMRLTTAGFLGLGTSNPTSPFQINSSATTLVALKSSGGTTTIDFQNTNTDTVPSGAMNFYRGGTFGGSIQTTAANSLFINSNSQIDFAIGGVTKYRLDSSGNSNIFGTLLAGTSTINSLIVSNSSTSTFAGGINLTSGCYAIAGTCIGSGSGSGTVNTGTTGQNAYYAANGTAVTGTSSLFTTTGGNIGIGTTTTTIGGITYRTLIDGKGYFTQGATIPNDTPLNFFGGSSGCLNSTALKTGTDGTFLFDAGCSIKFKGGSGLTWGYTDSSFNYVFQSDSLGNTTQNGAIRAASTTVSSYVMGNIGIGTTSPLSALEIGSGQIRVPNGTAALPSYSFSAFPAYGIYFNSASGLVFSQNGSDVMGTVGSGMAFPSTKGLIWTSGAISGTQDTAFYRQSAGKLALGNAGSTTDLSGTLVLGNIGVGTSTTIAKLSLLGGTTDLITAATSTAKVNFKIDADGHIATDGYSPTLSACGTSPIVVNANDIAGTITVGSGVTTACTVTFSKTYGITPKSIQITTNSGTISAGVTAKSATAFTVTFTGTFTSGSFDYYVIK